MKQKHQRMSVPRMTALLAALMLAGPAQADTLQRIQQRGEMRVCIWPDYYGISYRNPKTRQLSGLDIDLSAELARELGVRLQHVDSSFATLVEDVHDRRCDIAMFAVAVLPQRRAHLAFSQPYLSSGIHAITTRSSRVVRRWEDIDRPGVQVGVQAGTFMESVMRDQLRQASLNVIRAPETREQELESGRIDVFMTDYPYSRRLLDSVDWARLISPPQPQHVMPYAYAVRPGDSAWLTRVDQFVEHIRQDGRLAAAARRHGLSAIVQRTGPAP
jgi:ABC-type amino acid transport substrate-binding protein